MFNNYNEELTNYIPNNLGYVQQKPYPYPIPYVEYNAEGEQVGYYWYQGDTVNLSFDLIGELTVESGAIVYFIAGEHPTTETEGELYQKAYNVNDLISWTLDSIVVDGDIVTFNWVQDEEFTYPEEGQKGIYLPATKYVNGMTAQIKIYNFRFEEVYSYETNAVAQIVLSIGKDLSQKMIKGIYYITLTLIDETTQTYLPLFKDKECTITVK